MGAVPDWMYVPKSLAGGGYRSGMPDELIEDAAAHAKSAESRAVIGIAGAPAAGKSTLARVDRPNGEIVKRTRVNCTRVVTPDVPHPSA